MTHPPFSVNPSDRQPNRLRVLIADDHPAMRHGLADAIDAEADMQVIGQAADGRQAIELFRQFEPDVLLIDLQMPRVDGLEAIATIRKQFPAALIIVLTTYAGDARVMRALTLGASSYLLKAAELADVVQAIRSAVSGKPIVDPGVASEMARHAGCESLTPRELSVLRLAAMGQSNRAIGQTLNISEDTVKSRMRNIMGKLGAEDRTHAVTIAMQRGFLDQ
ncbi:response regulator [Dyella choica]|uniref:Response regulator transcription factor n=1 Tax=Dyella choica TaxID=1927959 RepID=A0A3S0PPP5_9GAMM|nr:response regulator transcription factor [Dyella choica]RUL78856.1 response regulator transcription factor [Dyella choica]